MTRSKTISTLAICIYMGAAVSACTESREDVYESKIDEKVESLLGQMSLEEKAGQMTNISLMALAEGEFWMRRDTVKLDTAKIRALLIDAHVGSVQNLGTYPFAPDEWRKLIGIIQDVAIEQTRLGIPLIYGIDAVHGANYTAGSTLFPHQLGMAATWNPDLVAMGASITSYEMRASGIPWNYAPVLDVCKQPLWGRIFETYGEDTYLTSTLGTAFVEGAQGPATVGDQQSAVCLKHFWGYGQPATGKDRSPTYLPERLLRQYHLPPFEAALAAGARTVMINSGAVNGVPSHADRYLITDILKGELGFTGFTISDWEDVVNLVEVHQVAHDEREAVKLSVNAGLDMCMDPYDASFATHLIDLVQAGEVTEGRVNDAVRRILRVKHELGLFDQPLTDPSRYPDFGSEKHSLAAREAASESLTLLKNESSALPLRKNQKVLVAGVAAHSLTTLNGAWSRTWSGQDTTFNDRGKATILEAIRNEVGPENTLYALGSSYDTLIDGAHALSQAKKADCIVLCLGEKPATEKPSDIDDLTMPAAQLELAKMLAETGKPMVLVLVQARPRIISAIEPLADAILMAYLPGNEGGVAIADVLFGKVNPSGKLPVTYPRHTGSLWAYDHTKADIRDDNFGFEGFNPQFEFGHGLSYTDFSYSDLRISRDTLSVDAWIEVTVNVENTGEVAGKEVVQLYSSDLVASVVPAVKQLRRYQKISLEPGEMKEVQFTLRAGDLAFVNTDLEWVTEAGDFDIHVGDLTTSFYFGAPPPKANQKSKHKEKQQS